MSITVTPVNDDPVAVDDSLTVTEDTPLMGNVLTNDTDVDNILADFTVTQFTVAGIPSTTFDAGGTATISGVGTLVINGTGLLPLRQNLILPVPFRRRLTQSVMERVVQTRVI